VKDHFPVLISFHNSAYSHAAIFVVKRDHGEINSITVSVSDIFSLRFPASCTQDRGLYIWHVALAAVPIEVLRS